MNIKNLTKKQEERVEKFWDKTKLNGLINSNIAHFVLEHHLISALCLEDEKEFLLRSEEFGLLKDDLIDESDGLHKIFNEEFAPITSLEQLVKRILESCRLDVEAIEKSDPEFIGYISDQISRWHNENK